MYSQAYFRLSKYIRHPVLLLVMFQKSRVSPDEKGVLDASEANMYENIANLK